MEELQHVALVIPHTDITAEMDLQTLLPGHVIHAQRMWLDEVSEGAERKMVAKELPLALRYLKGITPFQCGIFGCTSASAVNGKSGMMEIERLMEEELGCPSITVLGAVLREIERRKASSVAIFTPYSEEVNQFLRATMERFEVPVSFMSGMDIASDIEIAALHPTDIVRYIKEQKSKLPVSTDLCFFSCTNVRAAEIQDILSDTIGKPVITSNQCVMNFIRSLA